MNPVSFGEEFVYMYTVATALMAQTVSSCHFKVLVVISVESEESTPCCVIHKIQS